MRRRRVRVRAAGMPMRERRRGLWGVSGTGRVIGCVVGLVVCSVVGAVVGAVVLGVVGRVVGTVVLMGPAVGAGAGSTVTGFVVKVSLVPPLASFTFICQRVIFLPVSCCEGVPVRVTASHVSRSAVEMVKPLIWAWV